jgi:hypothetical protein
MVRKSLDKQWNLQNSILLHETIPLNREIEFEADIRPD